VAIGWTVADAYPGGHTGQVVVRSADGGFGPVREVHDDVAGVQKPQVAIDDDANVLFLWNNGAEGRTSFMPAGGPAGPTETVPGRSTLEYASGFDSTGVAVVAWTKLTYPEDHRIVQTAERLRDGTWVGPQTIADVPVGEGMRYQQDPPSLAFDRAGGALLTWTLAPEWRVFVADYDRRAVAAPAPVISALKTREVSRAVRVSFRLSRPASVRATLSGHKQRSSRGLKARRGRNTMRIRAPRTAGRYRLTIVARSHGARSTRRLHVKVRGRG
jgi:hypothetical protein